MKYALRSLAAWLLILSSLGLQAEEKRYRIELSAAKGDVFGKPVAFLEIVPTPNPLYAPPPPPALPDAPAPGLTPIPEPYASPAPGDGLPAFQTVELYHRVKYEDLDNVHPQAIEKIVAVKDPCIKPDGCANCTPSYVFIKICVPPWDKFKFEVKRKDYSKVEYDYGDYEIEITSKDGVVYVDYDD